MARRQRLHYALILRFDGRTDDPNKLRGRVQTTDDRVHTRLSLSWILEAQELGQEPADSEHGVGSPTLAQDLGMGVPQNV
eukprot:CAMPEP_0206331732 /NCGR_PEP_ID=MMETSP0106_2-20121207/24402_1 /ASSEMBLY_ACC=CAM_ASM_000206 /TAXON_ID=81532 /ORGANISM="Acanthoeca-like sp., Strain 10tr" /LENGTH=79 /DNA_ID=CAMNT_0053764563 /DNA_START=161 /DNA_END=400 /DNA_ORIENTATION=+